eukprot:CAMPEP_0197525686 /NCGR_PEP_ID=MMETSP1318-20131121/13885_1 /TAXON_ID=552666 /ORGANISM="Partenskyella glossopodia, Strain RCC365" /LENGTH=712 /DNA_ID=CAMNT_0043079365 /DNA_START=32 /DNA_END=2170 /DNA_ORIENTATION=+
MGEEDQEAYDTELQSLEEKLAELEKKRDEIQATYDSLSERLEKSTTEQDDLMAQQDKLKVNVDLTKIVVVDNIPAGVPESKHQKLKTVLGKKFLTKPKGVRLKAIDLIVNEKKATKGYAFAHYGDSKSASEAAKANNNKKLDKSHKLVTNIMTETSKYEEVPDEFRAPEKPDIKERPNFRSWLMDETVRDQFVVRHGDDTQVFWNDPYRCADEDGRKLMYGGEREKAQKKHWTQSLVKWSPKGSFLATFHVQGIALWGGKDFRRVGKFVHRQVTEVQFSPGENYLVTCNFNEGKGKDAIIIWDIDSGKKLRSFDCSRTDRWPIFEWSCDDKYTCRARDDKISVFEVPSMNLLDKKSITRKSVQTAKFSPSNPLIAAWVPENGAIPASMHIIEIPSKKVVRERHFYSINDLKLHWHPQGDFLCAQLCRQKSKKTLAYSFEIFRMRSKNIPVEVMEMKDRVVDFAWEPNGTCFAVAHGDKKSAGRNHVTLYTLAGSKLKLLKTFESRLCNKLYWSPIGRTLIMAGLGQMNGVLEFVDVNTLTSLTTGEHFMCTYIEWDPSGRFVFTAVTQRIQGDELRYAMENGYKLWTSQGKNLVSVSYSHFYQILWRPRPPSILSADDKKRVQQELRSKWWRKFEKVDERIRLGQLSGQEKVRQDMKEAWKKYRERRRRDLKDEAKERDALFALNDNGEEEFTTVESIVETVVSRKEEIVEE